VEATAITRNSRSVLLFGVAAMRCIPLARVFAFPSTTIRDGRKCDQPTFQPVSLKKLDTNARRLP
jgi:hypothetical protein